MNWGFFINAGNALRVQPGECRFQGDLLAIYTYYNVHVSQIQHINKRHYMKHSLQSAQAFVVDCNQLVGLFNRSTHRELKPFSPGIIAHAKVISNILRNIFRIVFLDSFKEVCYTFIRFLNLKGSTTVGVMSLC